MKMTELLTDGSRTQNCDLPLLQCIRHIDLQLKGRFIQNQGRLEDFERVMRVSGASNRMTAIGCSVPVL